MSNSPLHFKIIETPAGTNEVEWKHSTRHKITALELRTLDMYLFLLMHQEENQVIFTSLMSYDSYCQFTGFRFSVSVCLVPRPLRTLCLSMKSWQLRSGRSGTRKRRRRRPATRDCWRSVRQSSRNGALVCGTQVFSLLQPIKVSITS